MRFVLYVKGDRGVHTLAGLMQHELSPALCVSEKAEAPILDFCKRQSLPVFVESQPKKAEHIAMVQGYKPELLVCAGYSKILPMELFSGMRHGAINCHGGRLPEYQGASPIPWQIINGETYGIAYVLKMTAGVDDGPILAQARYEIGEQETARHITDKVAAIFERIIPDVVEAYSLGKPPAGTPQRVENACHWTRRYPDDGLIVWSRMTTRQVVNLVRALDDPYPGAYIMRNGEKIIIRRARLYDQRMAGIPGRCIGKTQQGALILATDGAVEVLEFIKAGLCRSGSQFPARYGETF